MIKKLINQTKRYAWLVCLLAGVWSASAQSGSYGNTFVHSGSEAAIHAVNHSFLAGGLAPMDGIIGTERTSPRGYVGFVTTASWSSANDAKHIDGYARTYMTSSFLFPIGDNGRYRPCRVSTASFSQPASAAYFGVNPSVAVTSSLKGGNEPALPSGTYNTLSTDVDVKNVSTVEYWDINGQSVAQITLTWDGTSGVAAMTGGNLSKLTIVGWTGTKWIVIPSVVDVTSILGGASTLSNGSITTTSPITPDAYEVYTLAVSCPVSTPTAVSLSRNAVCLGSPIMLSASSGDTLKWFKDAALTQLVGVGNNLTVTPAASTRYYAAQVSGICYSTAASDSVTVATNCPPFPISDTVLKNPVTGSPIVVGPSIATPTGGSVSAAILGGFYHRAVDAQSISTTTGQVSITPNDTAFVGQDTLIRQICYTVGGVTTCDTSLIIIDNKAPNKSYVDTTPMNTPKVLASLTPLIFEGGAATTTTSSTRLSISGGVPTYTPTPGFVGMDTQYVYRCDGATPPNCDTTRYVIAVKPSLADSVKATTVNTPISVGPAVTPQSGMTDVASAKNGTVTKNPDGTLTYTPNKDFVGTDTMIRIVCTTLPAFCDTQMVIINVAPKYADTAVNVNPNTTVTAGTPIYTMLGSSTVVTLTGPSHGTAVKNADGTVTYTPTSGFAGKDTVMRVVCVTFTDNTTKCDTSLIVYTVGINNPDTTVKTTMNTSVTAGPGTTGPNVTTTASAKYGTTVVNSDGTVTYTPNKDFVGTDTVRKIVCVGTVCDTSFIIVNIAPNYADTSVSTPLGTAVTAGTPVKVIPGSSSSVTKTGPSNGTATINADGTVTYLPKTGFVGLDTIRRIVCITFTDNTSKCDTSFIVIRVTPNLGDTTANTNAGTPVNVGPAIVSTSGASVSQSVSAGHGNAIVNADGTITYTPDSNFYGTDTVRRIVCVTYSPSGTTVCDTSYIIVTVSINKVVIPNYISPNGDGLNDIWNIDGLLGLYPNAKALNYNRWGNVVWRSTGPYGKSTSGANVWYGQLEGSQDPVPDGVYYYLLELEDEFKTTKTGFIEVMRQ